MTLTKFEQVNAFIAAPPGEEDLIAPAFAYVGQVHGTTLDGAWVIVTAWEPSEQERADIAQGKPVYFSMIGAQLVPHFLTTDLPQAMNPG